MSERRTEIRFEVCLDAIIGTGGRCTARVTDLSENGCYIDSMSDAFVDGVLEFKIRLPSGEWLELVGEVAHHTPRLGFGVRFIELDSVTREKIQMFIRQLRAAKETRTKRTA